MKGRGGVVNKPILRGLKREIHVYEPLTLGMMLLGYIYIYICMLMYTHVHHESQVAWCHAACLPLLCGTRALELTRCYSAAFPHWMVKEIRAWRDFVCFVN